MKKEIKQILSVLGILSSMLLMMFCYGVLLILPYKLWGNSVNSWANNHKILSSILGYCSLFFMFICFYVCNKISGYHGLNRRMSVLEDKDSDITSSEL